MGPSTATALQFVNNCLMEYFFKRKRHFFHISNCFTQIWNLILIDWVSGTRIFYLKRNGQNIDVKTTFKIIVKHGDSFNSFIHKIFTIRSLIDSQPKWRIHDIDIKEFSTHLSKDWWLIYPRIGGSVIEGIMAHISKDCLINWGRGDSFIQKWWQSKLT
jgi:hypothetical protein